MGLLDVLLLPVTVPLRVVESAIDTVADSFLGDPHRVHQGELNPMSTTFYCPEAPRRVGEFPCSMHKCTPQRRCGFCTEGIEYLDEPLDLSAEANFSSGNAAEILRLIGLAPADPNEEPSGTLSLGETPQIRDRIDYLLTEPFHMDVRARLLSLKGVLTYAIRNSFIVRWG